MKDYYVLIVIYPLFDVCAVACCTVVTEYSSFFMVSFLLGCSLFMSMIYILFLCIFFFCWVAISESLKTLEYGEKKTEGLPVIADTLRIIAVEQ